ncbi:MAG: nucleotidyl transferase AbiEii/AbiGii toxin family protein [Spirochaetaceae bacterium]|jgi:predicted nucleotidyltransferase component of viral defense system|nr:nucleotidyl transferase AbiEii/AbiGii toxin family protein [Spirochaetaceae bacterium]
MKDLGASLLAKLKNKSNGTSKDYQRTLLLFMQEEFLRRLSLSRYADNLILKGGLFIYTLSNFQSRTTVDTDFLAWHLDNQPSHMDSMVAEILSIPTDLSDVVFMEATPTKPIALEREYHGVRTQIIGHIKKARIVFDVDIGVGDVIVPEPEKLAIQPQLEEYGTPVVYTYSLESTIAEKFDAILQRFEFSSRMKDYFDIFYLAHTFDFEGNLLIKAVSETLRNRRTEYDGDSFDRIMRIADNNDVLVRWHSFRKKMNQTGLSLSDVFVVIEAFLRPVFETVVAGSEFSSRWYAKEREWM